MRTCGCDTSPCLGNGFGIRRGTALLVRRARPVSSDGGVCDMQAKSEHLVAQHPAVESCCVEFETKLCVTCSDLGIQVPVPVTL